MAKVKKMPLPAKQLPDMPDKIQPNELTPDQFDQWRDTMSLMTWTCPGFQHIFYKLLVPQPKNDETAALPMMTADVPIAATDAQNIILNPETFFKYNLSERVFIVAHEIGHNMYGDVEYLNRCAQANVVPMDDGTTLPYSEQIMQQALDYRLNALLVDSKIGTLPRPLGGYHLCYDEAIGKANDSRTDVYKKLFKKYEDEGKIQYIPGFDRVLKSGISNGNQTPRNQEQWGMELEVAQTLEGMRTQGSMSGSLKRMFQQLLNPEIPWTDHIRGVMIRSFGNGSYDWRRADRRFIVRDICLPARSGKGSGWLVVWGDTSGSISNPELCRYMAELAGIVEDCKPRRLTILWCDSKIHRIDEVEETSDLHRIHAEGVGGGGGTSVHPVMEWIEQGTEVPDMMVAFTDGHLSFPKKAPVFPVIWAMTTAVKAPWGEEIRLKTKAA